MFKGADLSMVIKIKCELMSTWDFEHCQECKRFRVRRGKGLSNWECILNKSTSKERRDFGEVWASAKLQDRGMKITIPVVEIIYVGKKRKKK